MMLFLLEPAVRQSQRLIENVASTQTYVKLHNLTFLFGVSAGGFSSAFSVSFKSFHWVIDPFMWCRFEPQIGFWFSFNLLRVSVVQSPVFVD